MNNDLSTFFQTSDVKFLIDNLHIDVSNLKLQPNRFGLNNNIYIAQSGGKKFVIKVYKDTKASREFEGLIRLREYISVPKAIYKSPNNSFIVMEFVEGELLIERYKRIEEEGVFGSEDIDLEIHRNKTLSNMYSLTQSSTDYEKYVDGYTNNLFYKRLFGKRFDDFYLTDPFSNISSFFDKNIIFNGKRFDFTINDIFKSIKNKYKHITKRNSTTILGHGDSHCWNILVGHKGEPVFIDTEFYGDIPIFMEYAKPYYSDFLGSLFYHFPNFWEKYFVIKKFEDDSRILSIKIDVVKEMDFRIKMTQVKADYLSKTLKTVKKPHDFLEFRDYLIMSHALARDPNKLSKDLQIYFLALFPLLYSFDYLDVRSFYSFF